ncbi:hypothetical protein AB4Y80_04065 [Specibacter sp. RAF43]
MAATVIITITLLALATVAAANRRETQNLSGRFLVAVGPVSAALVCSPDLALL